MDRTIAYCEVISIVDMGSNFFDEFPSERWISSQVLLILVHPNPLKIQMV